MSEKSKIENIKGVIGISGLKDKSSPRKTINTGMKILNDKLISKEERIKRYRAEASRLSAMANKRVERLEANNLQDSPAYQAYISGGGGRFGVRGKDFNQVQAEVARLERFLNSNTSTITGLNSYLRDMAENTGIKYSSMKELQQKSGKFFELSNKVEEYLRTVEDMASAIGYQKIWEAVNIYTSEQAINLADANVDIDSMIQSISDALTEHQKVENVLMTDPKGAFITDSGLKKSTWFKLKKD